MASVLTLAEPFRSTVRSWLNQVTSEGIRFDITSTRRSSTEQARLFFQRQQLQAQGIPTLPAAPPGRSLHEQGLAIDLVVDPLHLPRVVQLAGEFGIRWGGMRDPVHFEAGDGDP